MEIWIIRRQTDHRRSLAVVWVKVARAALKMESNQMK
jgi:hypothetical protein